MFHLASVPGGAAESSFELGLRVNLEATVELLEALRNTTSVPRYVFASTIGVYGVPMPDVIGEDTIPAPSLSYGAHKLIGEILAADYSRRGHIDGVSLRLPGIVARPPQASGMLSAFLSDMLREVAAGHRFVCPVAKTGVSWWMSRSCVVDNLLHAAELPQSHRAPAHVAAARAARLDGGSREGGRDRVRRRCRGPRELSRRSKAPRAVCELSAARMPRLARRRFSKRWQGRVDGDARSKRDRHCTTGVLMRRSLFDLTGKVALVTGATRALALRSPRNSRWPARRS